MAQTRDSSDMYQPGGSDGEDGGTSRAVEEIKPAALEMDWLRREKDGQAAGRAPASLHLHKYCEGWGVGRGGNSRHGSFLFSVKREPGPFPEQEC